MGAPRIGSLRPAAEAGLVSELVLAGPARVPAKLPRAALAPVQTGSSARSAAHRPLALGLAAGSASTVPPASFHAAGEPARDRWVLFPEGAAPWLQWLAP